MGTFAIAAFVTKQPTIASSLSNHLPVSPTLVTYGPIMSTSPSTAISMVPSSVYQQAALGFFSGIRIPASLIAGSSVAATFSLVQKAKDTKGLSRLEIIVLRLYHAVAILSLCLSMVTISTTTTASTLLLLTSKISNKEYSDIYHFLRSEFNYEFVLTRWAFSSSIVLFLIGVATRILLEMDLLKPERRTGGLLVVSTMMATITAMLSNINLTLNCWPDLIGMTVEVFKVRA